MSFTSIYFWAAFLPVVLLLYYLPARTAAQQNAVLLAAGLVFYSCYDLRYLLLLGGCILLTYTGARLGRAKKAPWVFRLTAAANLGLLVVFKYTGFVLGNLSHFGLNITAPALLLPVGISYYIFQSTAYLLEVSSGAIPVEKNFLTYALYVSFFPTITAGPIQRGKTLLPQFQARRAFAGAWFQRALLLFLWGAFQKMVLADRLALFVDTVFGSADQFQGVVLAAGAAAYSLQIYLDFAGYSTMAVAISLFLGLCIAPNFRQPYLATTVADFWRRWHISLTSWLRDFIYIPLGGSRRGTVRKYCNIAAVFLISGLWHGAGWNFIFWGALHAFYQIVGSVSLPLRRSIYARLGLSRDCAGHRWAQRLCVFALVTLAWIFFRCGSMGDALLYCTRMLGAPAPWDLVNGTLLVLGLSGSEWCIVAAGLAVVFGVSRLAEQGRTTDFFMEQNALVRLVCCQLLFFAIVIFGVYGPGFDAASFIYAGF